MQPIRIHLLYPFLIVLVALGAQAQEKPNIVLLFSDDAGYADFGFHGSKTMRTPNLDRLRQEGMLCSQAYVTDPTCGPSRAGLMTGRYQQRFGYEENNVPGYMSKNSAQDGEDMGLPVDEKTMGQYLQQLGYRTAFFGKWHLGGADKFHPTHRGFDEFYGFRGGARSYFDYNGEPADALNKMEHGFEDYQEPDTYLTDALAGHACQFIDENNDRPFFAFVSFNAVHTPMDAIDQDLEQYPSLEGNRQIVAAMTTALDRACGKILNKLDELGLSEKTLIVFTNDNGGPTDKNASSNYPLSGTKSNHLEGGIRVPFIIKWTSKLPSGSTFDFPVSTFDLLPTFAEVAGGKPDSLSHLDGVNLIPYLVGQKNTRPHQLLFWKKDARATVRDGDWKLLRFPDRPAELYNIADDPREQNNLAETQRDKVRALYKTIFEWESQLERPRWMLKRKYENVDLDRMDKYRDQSKYFTKERGDE